MGGGGSTYDYGFRIYNPNLGRFLSVDPLIREYPELTPYQFASNRPICAIDRDGLEAEDVGAGIDYLIIPVLGIGCTDGCEPLPGKTQTKNAKSDFYQNGNDVNGLGHIGEFYSSAKKTKVVTYASSHNPRTTASDIEQTIVSFKKNNPQGKVILIGHSAGAVNVVSALQSSNITCADLVITVDASFAENYWDAKNGRSKAEQMHVGNNSDVFINFHNEEKGFIQGAVLDLHQAVTDGVNIPIANSTHKTIDNKLLPMILAIINVYMKTGVVPVKQVQEFDYSKIPEQPNLIPEPDEAKY